MMIKRAVLFSFLLFTRLPLFADDPVRIEATVGGGLQDANMVTVDEPLSDNVFSTKERVTSRLTSPLFDLGAAISIANDGQYGADIVYLRNSGTFMNNYILIDEGYTTLHLRPLDFQIGIVPQKEIYQSPYSLFLNSRGQSAFSSILQFSSPHFWYESRWILLNQGSNFGSPDHTPPAWRWANGAGGNGTGFPDRGANLKTFLFQWGSMRLGLQEATVYTNKAFDPAFFFSPVPEYFTQYLGGTSGRPWTTLQNDNYIMGLFWDWREADFSLGGQLLIDDFSLNFLNNSIFPNNPWKAAWTVGGTVKTDFGTIGLYHAGALKYTFEPITTIQGQEPTTAYGNTYYPDVQYWANGSLRSLSLEDNSIGYVHGENNLALMVTWERLWSRGLRSSSSFEFVLAGNNSPANPWQDATGSNQSDMGTQFLNDPVLQKSFIWTGGIDYRVGDWDLSFKVNLGYIFNVLTLQAPSNVPSSASYLDQYVEIYKPSSQNQGVYSLFLGATWHWDLSSLLDSLPPVVPQKL